MGWTETRGDKVRAVWRQGDRRVSVLCDTQAEADLTLIQMTADRSRGVYIDPSGGAVTVKAWAELWIAARPHLKVSSELTDKSRMDNHIVTRLGAMRLDYVTPLVVRKWVADLAKPVDGKPGEKKKPGLSAKSIRNCHGLLYSLMQGAVDERLIATNPCTSTRLPEVDQREMHFLTGPEVQRLIAALPEHYKPLVSTTVGTGLRWGEVAGLRRKRVDLLAGKLEVIETLHERGAELFYGTPKSKASRRVIGLPPYLVDMLIPLSMVDDPDGPFFTTEHGALLRRGNFSRRVWTDAVKEAGLPKGLRFHDLRHTHVAHLISAGNSLTAISRRLGHGSIRITSDVYGHLLPEADETMMSTLQAAFAPTVPPNADEPVPSA